MIGLPNAGSGSLVAELADAIVANKAWLSEIDGLIGDGDHGANMAKGFARARDRLAGRDASLSEAMAELSDVLLSEIGGSMGPLYGLFFEAMAEAIAPLETIDVSAFGRMLSAGTEAVREVGGAKVGDKTLMDVLDPAVAAWDAAQVHGFASAVVAMSDAGERGRDSTVDLVSRLGRSARLGERSRGVMDAGAASCCLILQTLGRGAVARLTG